MPIYDYLCRDCGLEFEMLIRSGESAKCPACVDGSLEKLLSMPAIPRGNLQRPLRGEGPSTGRNPCGMGDCGLPDCS